jgi:hypothetical protein
MPPGDKLSQQLDRVVNHGSKVRAKLTEVGDLGARRAATIAAAEEPDVEIGREGGIRPGTHAEHGFPRAFERITAPADQEHGTSNKERRRILGRVWSEL